MEAFVRVSAYLPDLPMRLVIAGHGELFDEVEARVEREGIGHMVHLPGWVPDVRDLLGELDVFVVSSLYEAGLSYSTREAMAAGLPVVSTDVFGARKALHGVPGNVLVSPKDPRSLAQGMRRMATVSEPESLRCALGRIGHANRDHARARYGQEEVLRRTLEIYRSLSDQKRRRLSMTTLLNGERQNA